jgi:hypothetical protein
MSCGGGLLGFPIGIKNRNLVKAIPMIIHLQFGFSQFISFREEDLWHFSQSEHIIGPGSHVEYPTGTKNRNFVEHHPKTIPAKFGSNWPCGFGEEAWNVKSLPIICSDWLKCQRSSSLKLMNWLNPNCKWMIIGMAFTKFLFFMWIGNPRWPPPQDID